MTLTKPDFKLDRPNPYASSVTDAAWWLWLRLEELYPAGELGGFMAAKKGFHSSGAYNKTHYPTNYSIRDKINQSGPGWTKSSAIDWTFPDAQSGKYGNIDRFSSRLLSSMLDKNDPRLDLILFEFFGQTDSDRTVEGYNEYREEYVSSDSSHLWHIHMSFIRSKAGDFWGMWALLTVLMGWSVAKWRESLPGGTPTTPAKPKPPTPAGLPVHAPGSRTIKEGDSGTDVLFAQKFIGEAHAGKADGKFGAKTKAGVIWYQRLRGLGADGVMSKSGPTWKAMGH